MTHFAATRLPASDCPEGYPAPQVKIERLGTGCTVQGELHNPLGVFAHMFLVRRSRGTLRCKCNHSKMSLCCTGRAALQSPCKQYVLIYALAIDKNHTNKTKVIRANLLDFDLNFDFEDSYRFYDILFLITFQFL